MELCQNQNAGVCKDNHLLSVSRLSQKASHKLMYSQASVQGEFEFRSIEWYSLRYPISLMRYFLNFLMILRTLSLKNMKLFLGSFKIQFTMFLDIYLKTFYVVKFFPPSNMKCILKCEMKNF